MSLTFFEENSQHEIDAVVNQLADNNISLAACSLVSKRWHARCRQQSFRRAKLADLDNLRLLGWPVNSDDILSGKLSSNNGAQGGELWVTSTPRHLDYFKSFDGITSLTLDHVTLFDFPALQQTFWGLIPTVVRLRLLYPRGSPSSLLQFITTFRNLEAVTVHAPSWTKPDQGIHHVRIGQLQGSLCLSEFDDKSRSFLSLLESHATGMKKVTISNCNFYDSHPLQRLLSSARRSIQTLEIIVDKNGEFPELSLQDFLMLERVFLSVAAPTISFHRISSLVSSITSTRFKSIVLKLRTTGQRERDAVQANLVDRISCLDAPLSHLACVSSKENHKVSLVLLGQDPEFLAQGLVGFHEVGYIWAGEEISENEYFWTFASPKNAETKRYRICILDRFFRQRT